MIYLGYPSLTEGGLTEGTYTQYCMISEKMGQLYSKISPQSVSLKEPSIKIDSFSSAKFEE
jgi:hypothetical protein